MKKPLKKILANFFIAFGTAWTAVQFAGFAENAFWIALFNAVAIGFISAGKEALEQCDIPTKPKYPIDKTLAIAKKASNLAVLI